MSTKRETLLARVQTALAGTSGVSTRIYRSREDALSRAEHGALIIEPVSDNPSRPAVGRMEWVFTFQVVTLIRADSPDTTADATVLDVHSKIIGDATLNGLVVDLMPGPTSWEFQAADKPLVVVTQQFIATYQTAENSLVA